MIVRCSSLSRGGWRPTRREMLVRAGQAGFGLTLPGLFQAGAAASRASSPPGRAKSCILLFLSGGASQYETFDPKPDAPADVRGTFGPIRTSVPGVDVCELLPRLARQAHRYALVRSLTHTDSNHPSGVYWLITGHRYPRAAGLSTSLSRQDHPHHGSVLARLRPTERPGVPSFVTLPEQMHPVGPVRAGQHAGFLGAPYDPLVVNADLERVVFRAGELSLREGLTEGRLLRRRALLSRGRLQSALESEGGSLEPHYRQAFELLAGSSVARAFDLEQESPALRERYGRHLFGQGTLLARRLVEAGVRLVAVNWVRHDDGPGGQGWDSHSRHLPWCKDELMPPTDAAVSALLEDLADRGMLDETLVVVTGEFGRTPNFNKEGGRDHWPQVFSALLAGGGIQGGQVHGASTPDGSAVAADPVSPGDLAATLYHCLGIPPEAELIDPLGRPFPIAEGSPIRTLL